MAQGERLIKASIAAAEEGDEKKSRAASASLRAWNGAAKTGKALVDAIIGATKAAVITKAITAPTAISVDLTGALGLPPASSGNHQDDGRTDAPEPPTPDDGGPVH